MSTNPIPQTGRELFASHAAFRSKNFEETFHVFSQAYPELTIEPYTKRTKFFAGINQLTLPSINFVYFDLKNGMQCNTHAPQQDVIIGYQISSESNLKLNDQQVSCNPNQPLIISSGSQGVSQQQPGSQIVNAVISKDFIKDTLSAWSDTQVLPPLEFALAPDMNKPGNYSALAHIYSLIRQLDTAPHILKSPAAIASLEMSIVTALLIGLPNNLKQLMDKPQPLTDHSRVKRVEEYIQANSDQPITTKDLAKIACCSVSSLFRSFTKYRDYTPLQFLQEIRLQAAYSRLRHATLNTQVSEVAAQCGFSHLGRFASLYRSRFGELPSETLTKHR